jgi:hypothetical protein
MAPIDSISLPVTLRLNRSRILLLSSSVLVLGALGVLIIFLGIPEKSIGIFAIGACFCSLAVLTLLSFRSKLTLTDEGFVHKGTFKSVAVRWTDVEDFVQGDFRTIGWNYLPEYKALTTMRKLNRGGGTEASIAGQFGGMSLEELVTILNRLRMSHQVFPRLTVKQQFGLAVSAILAEMNGHRHDSLYGDNPGQSLKAQMREVLSGYWNIKNRQQLDETLQWLKEEGHRAEYEAMLRGISNAGPDADPLELLEEEAVKKMSADEKKEFKRQVACVTANRPNHSSLPAWDMCRLVSVARFGAGAEYLTEAEAWTWILQAAERMRTAFGSWRELSENYLVGRDFSGFSDTDGSVERIIQSLLDRNNAASIWNKVPWDGARNE